MCIFFLWDEKVEDNVGRECLLNFFVSQSSQSVLFLNFSGQVFHFENRNGFVYCYVSFLILLTS